MSSEVIPSQVNPQDSRKSPAAAAPTEVKKSSKRRWSRSEKQAQREWHRQNPQAQHANKPKKLKQIPLSPAQKRIQCAQRARSTGSVSILHHHRHEDQLIPQSNRDAAQEKELTIHISTFCQTKPPQTVPSPFHLCIHVQPLLILDLNGILCHRIRHDNNTNKPFSQQQQQQDQYRPVTAHIANTDIIPRIDCTDFLHYLDANFCLAVWTSAKPKTAKQLVSLLVPQDVQERILFTWSQTKCLSIPNTTNDKKKVLYQKPLNRVWNEYPLWNESNTFLMDDSTQKCTLDFSSNTLHPPPLSGKLHLYVPLDKHGINHTNNNNNNNNRMSDLENEQLQWTFFQQLVEYMDSNVQQQQQQHEQQHDGDLQAFLERHGRGHMGWRGPSVACNE